MSPELFQILLIILPVILPPLVGLVVYIVKRELAKLPAEQQALVETLAESAVRSTQQTASAVLNGPGKKQLAVEKVEAALAHYGIKVAPVIINDAIEAAVQWTNHAPVQVSEQDTVIVPAAVDAAPKVDTKGKP